MRKESFLLSKRSRHARGQRQIQRVFFVAVWFGLSIGAVTAQTLITANPADMGDSRANLVNPAVVPWQAPLFSVGTEIMHLGVVDNTFAFRNNYFSLTAVDRKLGKIEGLSAGVQGQILNVPTMNAVAINGIISKKFLDKFSVGASVGVLNRAFDRSEFGEVEDESDPLLNRNLSKWVLFNLGVGGFVAVNRYLSVGLSVNQLTRPNMTFGAMEGRLPRTFSGGLAAGLSYFRGMLGFTAEGEHFLPKITFETFRPELGFLKIGYGSEAATFEGQLHVGRGVSLNYRYHYPVTDLNLASNGSHELGLLFNFRRRASLYDPPWFDPERILTPPLNPANAFLVESVFDTLMILDKYISRRVDSTISKTELADLPESMFFSDDGLEPDLPKMGAGRLLKAIDAVNAFEKFGIPSDSVAIINEMKKDHTSEYMGFLRNLAKRMQAPDFKTRIVVPADGKRAFLLLKYLSLYGPVTDRLEIAVKDSTRKAEESTLGKRQIPQEFFYRTLSLEADTFKFSIDRKNLRWGVVSWTLIVEDVNGNVIADTSGGVLIPRYHVWNWRLENGEVAPPATYYYYVRWLSQDGQVYTSPKRKLTINRVTRRIAIALTKGKDFPDKPNIEATVFVNY